MKRGKVFYNQHISVDQHGNKSVADVVRNIAKSGYAVALFHLNDGRSLSGRLVPVTPRSRSEFKVLTGSPGRPSIFHIKDVFQVSMPRGSQGRTDRNHRINLAG